jgi:hypothetical protein
LSLGWRVGCGREKEKEPKNFYPLPPGSGPNGEQWRHPKGSKVFWFFFSKKNFFAFGRPI